jgi:hypothetical protein
MLNGNIPQGLIRQSYNNKNIIIIIIIIIIIRPVTGLEVPLGCERSRLPHLLDNRLTDGGKAVSLTRWPPFIPRKIPGTHFCRRLSQPQGHRAAGRIR